MLNMIRHLLSPGTPDRVRGDGEDVRGDGEDVRGDGEDVRGDGAIAAVNACD